MTHGDGGGRSDAIPPGDGPVRLEATVRGFVQGVGFRYWVRRRATELELRGWVANELDGSVRCLAEGDRAAVERLLGLLRVGPPGAVVEAVEARWSPAGGLAGAFVIRAGAHRGD